jgi:hypothetical protein
MTGNNASKPIPTVTYSVVWVDENGNHIECHDGLSFAEANAKALDIKHEHGFHAYPAAEDVVSAVLR